MKKVVKAMGVLFLARGITAGRVWCHSRTNNPWNAKSVGNRPARDAHIVRNINPVSNPCCFFDGDESRLRSFLFPLRKERVAT